MVSENGCNEDNIDVAGELVNEPLTFLSAICSAECLRSGVNVRDRNVRIAATT